MTQYTYRSEIRDSTFNSLLERVERQNFEKYLYQIDLSRVRGFEDTTIKLEFPVTAIIGRNGSGKTTILGAAACLYDSIKPRQFFAKSGALDSSMQGWSMQYQAIDKSIHKKDLIKRTASFTSLKWSRDTLRRDVYVFGVIRTLPANERAELRRYASNNFSVPEENITSLGDNVKIAVSKILGKSIEGFNHVKVDKSGKITLLSGITPNGKKLF